MKKLFMIALFLLAPLALSLNFSGRQTLNGLGVTRLFTAPASAIYFVNGQLTLPMLPQDGGTAYSTLVATVSKNSTTAIYTGIAGATGFQVNNVSLVSGDYLQVKLSSTVSADAVLNAVRGDVYYGNSF